MCWKQFAVFFLTFCIVHSSVAQSLQDDHHVELEADPIAFILHGYSIHLGYESGHLRWDAGIYGAREPSFFTGYNNFNIKSDGAGIKMDYLFHKRKGLLLGLESDISREQVSLKPTGPDPHPDISRTFTNVSFSMRIGYRCMLSGRHNGYKGLYIFPWVSFLSVTVNPQSASLAGQEYRQDTFSYFPTVHIGYSF
jgi:hypothetical protein